MRAPEHFSLGGGHLRLRAEVQQSERTGDAATAPVVIAAAVAAISVGGLGLFLVLCTGIRRDDTAAQRLDKLETLLAPTRPSDEDVALLAELLSIAEGWLLPIFRLASA